MDEFFERTRTGAPPFPLTKHQADAVAARLRRRNPSLSYNALAVIMGEYHGVWFTDAHWRSACRRRGVPPAHERGFARREGIAA